MPRTDATVIDRRARFGGGFVLLVKLIHRTARVASPRCGLVVCVCEICYTSVLK
jgi:hypothetical protein